MTKLSDIALEGLQFELGAKAYLDMTADHLQADAVFETGEGFECIINVSFGRDVCLKKMRVVGPSKDGTAPYVSLQAPASFSLEGWTRTIRSVSQELEDRLCRDIGHKSERMLQQEAVERIQQDKAERAQYMEAFCEHYLRVHPGYDRQINSFNNDGTFANQATDWEFLAFIAGAEYVGSLKVDANPLFSPATPYFISAGDNAPDFVAQLKKAVLNGQLTSSQILEIANFQTDLIRPEHIRIDVKPSNQLPTNGSNWPSSLKE